MRVAEQRTQIPVGLLAAAMAGLAFAAYPLGAMAMIAAFVAVVLVVIAAVDVRSFTIPNRIVLPATAVVLVANTAFMPGRALEFVLAALFVGLALLLPNLIKSSWMGLGDVKLGLLLGAALGWGALAALEIAFVAVLPFAFVAILRGGREARSTTLPFGPFMAFGALAVLIVGPLVGLGG